jgi:hypothetical protein
VQLEDGTALTVLRQNLEMTAADALAERGRTVRLAWRQEDASVLEGDQQEEGET